MACFHFAASMSFDAGIYVYGTYTLLMTYERTGGESGASPEVSVFIPQVTYHNLSTLELVGTYTPSQKIDFSHRHPPADATDYHVYLTGYASPDVRSYDQSPIQTFNTLHGTSLPFPDVDYDQGTWTPEGALSPEDALALVDPGFEAGTGWTLGGAGTAHIAANGDAELAGLVTPDGTHALWLADHPEIPASDTAEQSFSVEPGVYSVRAWVAPVPSDAPPLAGVQVWMDGHILALFSDSSPDGSGTVCYSYPHYYDGDPHTLLLAGLGERAMLADDVALVRVTMPLGLVTTQPVSATSITLDSYADGTLPPDPAPPCRTPGTQIQILD